MQINADLRWDDARVFLAIWREGSLKRAAATLGVNVSTASRRLTGLEEALDTVLFDRSADGALPTAAATTLLPFAEAMEQAALDMAASVAQLEREVEGTVHITAPPGVVDPFVAGAIRELLALHPKLRLEVSASIAYLDLSRRQADLALRLRRPEDGDLVLKRLVSARWCVLASPASAKTIGTLRRPERHRWITWRDDLAHLPDASWLLPRVPDDALVLRTNGMTAHLQAARSGLGLLLASEPYAALPGLCMVPTTAALRRSLDALPPADLWLVGHRAHRRVPRIAAVWAWLEKRFAAGS